MKGDNIIEAYCALCGRPITAADLNLGFRIFMEDRSVHIHHDKKIIEALENSSIVLAVVEIVEVMFFNKGTAMTDKQVLQLITDKAKPLGIPWEELKKYLDGFLCRAKYAKSDPVVA